MPGAVLAKHGTVQKNLFQTGGIMEVVKRLLDKMLEVQWKEQLVVLLLEVTVGA